MASWSPGSWQHKQQTQSLHYPCEQSLQAALQHLNNMPPLLAVDTIEQFQADMTQVAAGKAFILQAGDCAEAFANCDSSYLHAQHQLLVRLAAVIEQRLHKPVITIGRIAGQYAKPRSFAHETQQAATLPSYRGELINHHQFDDAGRKADPKRLLAGYAHAVMTVNYLEMHAASNIYTSHEALHLPFEQAFTREAKQKWYNLSTHFPWLGMRTAHLDSAQLEYLRGIENPIGIKVGPDLSPEKLVQIIQRLNPNNLVGRISLITRLGYKKVTDKLPSLVEAVTAAGLGVIWICDPMHGNTRVTADKHKTRVLDDIIAELQLTIQVHAECNSRLDGVHLEATAADVAECLGGPDNIQEAALRAGYKSLVDPRLNAAQAQMVCGCF